MATTLLFDDPAWSYPDGSCRLRVWDNDAPGAGFTLAVLTQDAAGDVARSVTNAMDDIYPAIEDRWGIGTQILQQTLHDDGRVEWEDVGEIRGTYRWYPTDPADTAAELGITLAELAGA